MNRISINSKLPPPRKYPLLEFQLTVRALTRKSLWENDVPPQGEKYPKKWEVSEFHLHLAGKPAVGFAERDPIHCYEMALFSSPTRIWNSQTHSINFSHEEPSKRGHPSWQLSLHFWVTDPQIWLKGGREQTKKNTKQMKRERKDVRKHMNCSPMWLTGMLMSRISHC